MSFFLGHWKLKHTKPPLINLRAVHWLTFLRFCSDLEFRGPCYRCRRFLHNLRIPPQNYLLVTQLQLSRKLEIMIIWPSLTFWKNSSPVCPHPSTAAKKSQTSTQNFTWLSKQNPSKSQATRMNLTLKHLLQFTAVDAKTFLHKIGISLLADLLSGQIFIFEELEACRHLHRWSRPARARVSERDKFHSASYCGARYRLWPITWLEVTSDTPYLTPKYQLGKERDQPIGTPPNGEIDVWLVCFAKLIDIISGQWQSIREVQKVPRKPLFLSMLQASPTT